MDTPTTPSADVREALMGFRAGDTTAPSLSESQRVELLGQCTDLNITTWTISTIHTLTLHVEREPQCTPSPTHWNGTSCLDLPVPMDTPFLPNRRALTLPSTPSLAPTPLPWTPKYHPEQWVYTKGLDIKGQPHLGAAMVHVLTCRTLYIDAEGHKRNPHYHAGGTGGNIYGPRKFCQT
jgi:hypothetical protein